MTFSSFVARFLLCVAAGSAYGAASFYGTRFERQPSPAELAVVGQALFFEPALSASGKMACASCHDPQRAFGPPDGKPAQLGGAHLSVQGMRAVPSLMYRAMTPSFSEHTYDTEGDDSQDQGPTGGLTWDGRAPSMHDQAAVPLLSEAEMANRDLRAVVRHLAASPSAGVFARTFGRQVFRNPQLAWRALLLSLEVYQQSPAVFSPFSSKYDAFLRGQAKLTAQEERGWRAFNDPNKGNCASCHVSAIRRGAFPRFTDDGLIALGVPRNKALSVNLKQSFYDMGLCGPLRQDFKDNVAYCGAFKTPSLRNVATRKVFFHNGVYHDLAEAVRFYGLRDTQPEQVYGAGAQGPDDLPQVWWGNLNKERPFGQQPGTSSVLSEEDIADIVVFLGTLTDGYQPH